MYKDQNNKTIKKKSTKLNKFIMNEKPTNDITTSLNTIAEAIETQAEIMKNLQPLLNSMKELKEKLNRENLKTTSGTNKDGDIVITSLDIPSNHLDSSNSFKGKDTDVERFISMCYRQFDYYVKFYESEKKRVEFIESHLGTASEWYYTYICESQRGHPNSKLLLDEFKKFHLTDLPDSLKFKRLKELRHKWGNSSDFVTKFKLYATQLKIPEILQLELFEDRVHPLVKRKLQDLEPQRRTIETYSNMLMTYDNERDRHWNLESTKRKQNFSEEHQGKRKKFKLWNKKETSSKNEESKISNNSSFSYSYNNSKYENNKKSNINSNNSNYKNNDNYKSKNNNESKNSK